MFLQLRSTINTDASFHPQLKVGGYAFYIICDLFKIQKGGHFKKQPKTAMEAEMMCIANALYTVLMQKELPSATWIIINSDCLFAFEKIKRKSQDKVGRVVADILRKVRLAMSRRGVIPKFQFRHVKAHSMATDKRSIVNEWCDIEAKKWMRSAAKKVKDESAK